METRTVASNRKAYHNYHILEVFEAGIALSGSEIKSIRGGRISLNEAYIKPRGNELWLVGAHVPRYEAASAFTASHEPARDRKLLLHRQEINELARKVAEKGYSLVPVSLYIKGHLVKVGVGLGKGKKQYEKKDAIIEKETKREINRTLKRQT
ncbi:MAG: SsrA-binding protein SmpB [Dehalococcoidaceae bacterium]|nr:SsrA-binding protein SmpB [Dehalococcoidaceae bacterium]